MSITITHSKSGAKAEVHTFGAHLTSFVASNGRDILFVSKDALFDGSKAIRGGAPIVFPQFGQPNKDMPQHGFLRINEWTVDEGSQYDSDEAAGISMSLKLADVKKARGETGDWAEGTDLNCTVIMSLKIDASALTQTLTMQNTAATAFTFQTLFHTYYQVDNHQALDKDQCNVMGLEGYQCIDNISGEEYTQGSNPIIFDRNIEQIYTPQDGANTVDIIMKTGADTAVNLKAFASIDGTELPMSCVVWNPHKEKAKAFADLNDDAYHDMICCEPGLLTNIPQLEGGKECVFTQIMSIA